MPVLENCALCCEDKAAPDLRQMVQCSHRACGDCMVKWIVRLEATGNKNLPKCPFCRLDMDKNEITKLLGRPYQPAHAANNNANTGGDSYVMDELTLQWMQEHTRACLNCGARVEKKDGCDKMECLCGYRFCFACGAQRANCSCTPSFHNFWDNIQDCRAADAAPPVLVLDANSREVNGNGHHGQQRRSRRRQVSQLFIHIQIRSFRADRQAKKEQLANEGQHLLPWLQSGAWLFAKKDVNKLQSLLQCQQVKDNLYQVRSIRRWYREDPLFLGSTRLAGTMACNDWLFCKTYSGSCVALDMYLNRADNTKFERINRRRQARNEEAYFDRDNVPRAEWVLYCRDPQVTNSFLTRVAKVHCLKTPIKLKRAEWHLPSYTINNYAGAGKSNHF